ncbi:interleukin-3 receptor subunit alpha [Phodopus roborovskii]|nr:interleukin-3 receptor subunit alpha [Phodopus roborovskii]
MAAALLLLLLLLPPPPLRAMTSPPPAPPTPPAPPFRNLRVDPALRRLSWERPRPGPRAACAKDGRSPVWAEPGRQHCVFPSLSRCHVTNLTVFAPGRGGAAWVLFPASDPNRAAAAADLRCWLHRVSRLSCRWGRGPGAPDDVQYRMFWRDAALGSDRDRECRGYDVTDAGGARLGCTVDAEEGAGPGAEGAGLPVVAAVTVTGSSARGAVSCSDAAVDLQAAEVPAPPSLRAECNGSGSALVRWAARSRFHRRFRFELEIRKGSQPQPEIERTSESHFRVPIPGSASFRVRARPDDLAEFSAWSDAARLDCPAPARPATPTAVTLATAGAGLAAMAALLLLCRR